MDMPRMQQDGNCRCVLLYAHAAVIAESWSLGPTVTADWCYVCSRQQSWRVKGACDSCALAPNAHEWRDQARLAFTAYTTMERFWLCFRHSYRISTLCVCVGAQHLGIHHGAPGSL